MDQSGKNILVRSPLETIGIKANLVNESLGVPQLNGHCSEVRSNPNSGESQKRHPTAAFPWQGRHCGKLVTVNR